MSLHKNAAAGNPRPDAPDFSLTTPPKRALGQGEPNFSRNGPDYRQTWARPYGTGCYAQAHGARPSAGCGPVSVLRETPPRALFRSLPLAPRYARRINRGQPVHLKGQGRGARPFIPILGFSG
jgi:hypothetical protein